MKKGNNSVSKRFLRTFSLLQHVPASGNMQIVVLSCHVGLVGKKRLATLKAVSLFWPKNGFQVDILVTFQSLNVLWAVIKL